MASPVLLGQQLLPGIPNEITLDKVTPKLSLMDLYTLSLVSPAWWQANRSRQVYDARVRSHSTETLAVLNYTPCGNTTALALFSTKGSRGRFCWELPPIPGLERGIPQWCQCVTLDGRVYILGGGLDSICENGGGKVFVMDLAGQRGWKRCASMGDAREAFGCCVKDGKICVFGGVFGSIPIGGSEVYDPNEDIWSPISPMPSFRYLHKVELMGDEFVLHGGKIWDPAQDSLQLQYYHPHTSIRYSAQFLQCYNPVKDEWGKVWPFRKDRGDQVIFIYQNKFHIFHGGTFAVYKGEGHQWLSEDGASFCHLKSSEGEGIRKILCSCATMGEPVPQCIFPWAVLPLNDELLVTLEWYTLDGEGHHFNTCLVVGKGFRTSSEEISMERAPFFEFEGHCSTKQFIVAIEL